jgi:hypothetical protein
MGFRPAGYETPALGTGTAPPEAAFVERPWMQVPSSFSSVPRQPVPDPLPAWLTPPGDWVPNHHQPWPLTELFRTLAMPIFERMPYRTIDDLFKLESAWRHIVFASSLPETGTRFMVTNETNGWILFRLHNELIERLQAGCENLLRTLDRHEVASLRTSGRSDSATTTVKATTGASDGRILPCLGDRYSITIFEHGQEDSTISGDVIGSTWRDRVRYFWRQHHVLIATLVVVAALIVGLVVLQINDLPGTSKHAELAGWRDRLATGLVPVFLINGVALIFAFLTRDRTNIRWTQRYASANDR